MPILSKHPRENVLDHYTTAVGSPSGAVANRVKPLPFAGKADTKMSHFTDTEEPTPVSGEDDPAE